MGISHERLFKNNGFLYMSQTVIKIDDLSKLYRLGIINHGMLYKNIQSWLSRKLGNEDPNAKIDVYNENKYKDDDFFWALKDVSFEVKRGDRIGIIGKNGAGKSTLLKILSRVTSPTSGEVRIKGRVASLLEVGTGFHPELTGRENIFLNGSIFGMSKKEIQNKFDEIVDFSGVEKFIDTPVKRYSSGMYVRLAFSIAAHLDPEILIIDEVLAVGDAEFQKKCLGKMEDVSKGQGRTILFVSHNMAAIQILCNRGILLESGKLFKEGVVEDIIHSYSMLLTDLNINISKDKDIKRFKILTIRHKPKGSEKVYTSNSGLVAELEFFTESKIKKAFLNIMIEDHENRLMIHARTDFDGLYPSFEKGLNRIKAEISHLHLKTGVYTLWFVIFNNDNKEHLDSEKVTIVIHGRQLGGLIDMQVKWKWGKIS